MHSGQFHPATPHKAKGEWVLAPREEGSSLQLGLTGLTRACAQLPPSSSWVPGSLGWGRLREQGSGMLSGAGVEV